MKGGMTTTHPPTGGFAKRWLFPLEEQLVDIERKARVVGNVDRETANYLVRVVRSQRRAIEKLVEERYGTLKAAAAMEGE